MSMANEPMCYREMLTLAAKAVGWKVTDWIEVEGLRGAGVETADGRAFAWYPLDEDDDALRLAVKLRISLSLFPEEVLAERTFTCDDVPGWDVDACEAGGVMPVDDDKEAIAVVRRTILRAAAEIGRAMA